MADCPFKFAKPCALAHVDGGAAGTREFVEEAQLRGYASVLVGMAAADASEVQVASYLGYVEDELGRPRSPARHRRLAAIALWHIAKAALIRDGAAGLPRAPEEQPPLPEWLRERLLRE